MAIYGYQCPHCNESLDQESLYEYIRILNELIVQVGCPHCGKLITIQVLFEIS